MTLMKRTFFLTGVLALAGLAALPASAGVVYNNDFGGVTSGDNFAEDAFTINSGFSVTNSFVLGASTSITGANFAVWAIPGDTLSSVNWYITTGPASGTTLASGTVSPTGSTLVGSNAYGYTILNESFNIPSLALNGATTYWFQLDTASVPNGDPIYWDESDGPSTGYQNGTLLPDGAQCNGLCTGSESFELLSSGTPEPGSLTLLGGGLLAMAAFLRRKKKA
jgi:hypothetical protein